MTKRIRLVGIVGLLGAALLGVGTTVTARAATRVTPQQTEWSDCVFAQPAPDPNTLIDTYTNTQLNVTVSRRCGNHDTDDTTGFGVRHINDRHGFDFNTEDCISNIVTQATILDDGIASGTRPRNEAFVFPGRGQLQNGVHGTVIYNVDTKNIVTAYVEGPRAPTTGKPARQHWPHPPRTHHIGPQHPRFTAFRPRRCRAYGPVRTPHGLRPSNPTQPAGVPPTSWAPGTSASTSKAPA
jgi:hypothetical protein